MKKFFMMAVMAVCALAANAQTPAAGSFKITPMVGVNVTNVTGDDKIPSLDSKVGFTAGAEALYMFDDMFGLSVGAMYSQQGAKGSGDLTWNADYINIPIMANSYLANGFAVKVGIQPGIKVNNKLKGNGFSWDGDKVIDTVIDGDHKFADFRMESLDIAIPVGASYEFSNVVIDARYNWSVTDMLKSDEVTAHNSVFQITLGYRF